MTSKIVPLRVCEISVCKSKQLFILAKNSFQVRHNSSSKRFVDSHGTAQFHPARDGRQFWDVCFTSIGYKFSFFLEETMCCNGDVM